MTPADLLKAVADAGGSMTLEGESLRIRAPKGALSAALRQALEAGKPALLAHLRAQGDGIRPRPRAARTAASLGQQRLWFLDQLEGARATYHVPGCAWLTGPLDIDALRAALGHVAARHEALRTSLPADDGRPWQRIGPARFPLTVTDVSAEADPAAAALRRATALVREPFDLEDGPLVRASLTRAATDRHLLTLSLHHAVADGWSVAIILRELSAAYASAARGAALAPSPAPLQYADFSEWQREQLEGPRRAALLAFWRAHLDGAPAVLDLPTDHPRPAVQSFRGAIELVVLDRRIAEAARAFAASRGATLFQLLLAVFQLLLHRYSHQDAVVVGTPSAGRTRPELEDLVGFVANTLPLRADFPAGQSFAALLDTVRAGAAAAYEHQDLPFDLLVGELSPERSLGHNPVFQAMFALQNTPPVATALGAATVEPVSLDLGTSKFDLYLSVRERSDGTLAAEWEYATDLFDAATIRRMAQHYEVLLGGAIQSPDEPCDRLPLLTAEEHRTIIHDWNRTERPWPSQASLAQLVEEQAARTPQATAVIDELGELTYRELDADANRLAHHLARLGVAPDAFVGVCLPRTRDLVVALLAILKTGAAYVPLDPAYPHERLAFIAADSGVALIVTDATAAAALPDAVRRVRIDAEAGTVRAHSADPMPLRVAPGALAYVIYTSGSTGEPKGILIEHRQAVAMVSWARSVFDQADVAGTLASTSICFDLSVFEIFLPLTTGGAAIVAGNALELPAHPAADRVTLINTVPSAIAELVRTGGIPRSVRVVNLAGEPLPQALADRIYALPHIDRVYDLYGPGETTTYSTCALRERGGRETVGHPIANTRLYILNRGLAPVPPGVRGEIYIGGAGVTRGYHRREALTRERYLEDPFHGGRMYRTGDVARFFEDGAVQYLGRADNQVKIRGFRIEPGEIEAALVRLGAGDCTVHPQRDAASGGQRLVAYYTGDVAADVLRRELGERMPAFMVPGAFVRLEQLPLTPNGKVDRRALPRPEDAPSVEAAADSPATAAERTLCAVWCDVLARGQVGVRDNFFQLGGDSILAIQVVSRARQAGLPLAPSMLFEHQTIAELASAVAPYQPARAPDVAAGEVPLTPVQHWCLAGDPPEPQHFSQWIVVDCPADLDGDALGAAWLQLASRHDALRLRFGRRADGWRQRYGPDDGALSPVTRVDGDLESEARRLSAGFDLERGPLGAAALSSNGARPRLLLVLHHLVVDGVSWRILLEDLVALYGARRRDAEPPPRARTDAFKAWAEQLRPAESPRLRAFGTFRDSRSVRGRIARGVIEELRRDAAAVYGARAEEALVAAFASALATWERAPQTIVLESHGRDAAAALDTSATVGWFTHMAPLAFDAVSASLPETMLGVQGACRAARRAGFDAAGDISFNYLGSIDGTGWPLVAAGLTASPDRARPHRLAVALALRDGALDWTIEYAAALDTPEAIGRLSSAFEQQLHALAAHCASPSLGAATGLRHIAPASAPQEGILLHSLLAPSGGTYVTQVRFALHGELDAAAFAASWDAVVRRHASLRCGFVRGVSGGLLQTVHATVPFSVEAHDLRRAPGNLDRLCEAAHQHPFDVAAPPLMRVALARTSDAEWHCIWTSHHAILDGWSLAIVLADLAAVYAARRQGKDAPLGAPRPWPEQIAAAAAPVTPDDEAFWRTEMATPADSGTLPGLTPRGDGKDAVFRTISRGPAPGLHTAIVEFARRNGLTVHTVLQGAWAILLSRATDRPRVTFGTTVSGRAGEASLESSVGLFIRTVPATAFVDGEATALGWLRELQRRQSQRERHAHVPLATIAEIAGVRGRAELFASLLVFENYPVDAALEQGVADLRVGEVRVLERPHYPLTVTVGEDLSVTAVYDESRLDGAIASDLVARFGQVLRSLVRRADAPVDAIDWMSSEEVDEVLALSRGPVRAYPPRTILDLFEEQVARTPEAIAVVFEDRSLTYAGLDASANRVGRMLQDRGATTGRLVAVALPRSLDLIVALYGVLKSGAAYVPVDPEYPQARREFMLADSGAALVLDEPAMREAEAHAAIRPDRSVSPTDPAYMIYTSGSTGTPKGAINSHAGISNRLQWMQEAFALDPSDAVLQKTPASFDVSVWEFFWPLLNGARLIVARPGGHVDPHYLAETIARQGITTLHFVPSMLRAFLAAADPDACRTLRRIIVSGEALPPDLAVQCRTALDAELHNLYGPTEAAVDVTWWAVPREGDLSVVPIGRPIANTSCYVLDGQRRLLPIGFTGELYLGGVQVGLGYWKRPDLTASRFVQDPFGGPGDRLYRTGDRARLLRDGTIEYLGRADEQVKIRGIRIEPGEIEAALRDDPRVRDAVVHVTGSGDDAELAGCVVSDESDQDALGQALRAALRTRLPEAMVPATIVALRELPRLPNGKIDRAALPRPGSAPAKAAAAPLRPLEQLVADAWREVLGDRPFASTDNFFDVGGHSLRMLRVHARLSRALGRDIPLTDLFEHPTVASLARHLAGQAPDGAAERRSVPATTSGPADIAVIGMACRFPGADTPDAYWSLLVEGREALTPLTDDELRAEGETEERLRHPRYVKAAQRLPNRFDFDAAFFDVPPSEAEILDPQQRIFLECAWEAFERAGYDPARAGGPVGVFAGAGLNTYAMRDLQGAGVDAAYGTFPLLIASDKDYLPTRVAYKLNLTGPAVAVQTACSTSLVAIAQACDALRRGDCDMALAGGVTVRHPQTGYVHEEGMIFSPDGRTRAYAADAGGMVPGSGAGVVLLKRLEDAIADGDHVHAVVKGIATNNDGSAKVGYTAPGLEGQVRVIERALERAAVDPGTIGLVEGHGTGTPLGDPIEVAALTRAWRRWTGDRGFCALGSAKSNIGHLDAAAGVAGFMKAVLALEHATVPPTLHAHRPNPALRIETTPFRLATEVSPWTTTPGSVRRAAVSSFGIGGTNAHAVLEQAPASARHAVTGEGPYVLLLSARTPGALAHAGRRLADRLQHDETLSLDDVSFTLATGRRHFPHRAAIVARDREDAVRRLQAAPDAPSIAAEARPVVFMFSGQGSAYTGMARDLYERFPAFRDAFDRCASLAPSLPLREVVRGGTALLDTRVAQPALFAVQHALCALWAGAGVTPAAVIGNSAGEYAAAAAAGMLSVEEAFAAVVHRAALLDGTPAGAALAVRLDEDAARAWLSGTLSLAVVLSPASVLISGAVADVDGLETRLREAGVDTRRLETSFAVHSPLVEDAATALASRMAGVTASAPRLPIVSNLTGTWFDAPPSADYWRRQTRETVQLSSGLGLLLRTYPNAVFLEIGPGRSFVSPLRSQPDCTPRHAALASLPPDAESSALDTLLRTAGESWAAGVPCDVAALSRGGRRVPLPTYPFERRTCRVQAGPSAQQAGSWLSLPGWRRSRPPSPSTGEGGSWLVLGDGRGPDLVAQEFAAAGARVVQRPLPPEPCRESFEQALAAAGDASRIVLWTKGDPFFESLSLVQALGDQPCHATIVTASAWNITGVERCDPRAAMAAGPARVAPQELEPVRTLSIDVDDDSPGSARAVAREAAAGIEGTVAYRNGIRWTRTWQPAASEPAPPSPLPSGAYIVTGGTHGVGLELATAVAAAAPGCRLILVDRGTHPEHRDAAEARLRGAAAVSFVTADVSAEHDVVRLFQSVEPGSLRGVIHAAGIAGGGTIALRERAAVEAEFAAKVRGTELLHAGAARHGTEILVLCASTSAVTGGIGSVAYTAANAFQDAYADAHAGSVAPRVVALDWYRWQGVGMAAGAERLHHQLTGERLLDGLPADRARALFLEALAIGDTPRVVICPHDVASLERRTRRTEMRERPATGAGPADAEDPGDVLATETEKLVGEVWRGVLGVGKVGLHDQFHALGGDSLLAVRVVSRLRAAAGVALTVRALYDTPTVASLARHIDAVRWARQSATQGPAGVGFETGVL